MMLETERLTLRRWEESEAENLYKCASDPDVGPISGWPPHQSVEENPDVTSSILRINVCIMKSTSAMQGGSHLKS